MKTLKLRLSKEIKNLYLVQGDDFYLFERAISMIKKAANLNLPDFNTAAFDNDNFTAQSLIQSCEVLPMGDAFRVVAVKGVVKITESDKKELLQYFQNISSSTIVIILDYGNKFDFIKEFAEFVDANRMDREILTRLIVKEVAKFNKKISGDAINTLIESCNCYLTRINNEIIKLAFYSGEEELITKEMVEKIVSADVEYTVFELTDALGKRQGDRAMQLLALMEKEPGILALISNHFRRLFFISISEMPTRELASYLGVKEFAITKAKSQLAAFSKAQLRKINQLLEKVDFAIKSGKMQANNALYYLVFNILYI